MDFCAALDKVMTRGVGSDERLMGLLEILTVMSAILLMALKEFMGKVGLEQETWKGEVFLKFADSHSLVITIVYVCVIPVYACVCLFMCSLSWMRFHQLSLEVQCLKEQRTKSERETGIHTLI